MIGKMIQEKRKERGLTQAQVAERLGVTAPAVNRWEKDLCYPDATLLAPLARLLKTDLNGLFSFYHSLSEKERELIVTEATDMLMTEDDHKTFAFMDEKIRENLSDGLLIKQFADQLYGKHTMLMASDPRIYLDRIAEYYEKALALLPEESDSISYSLATVYGELGDTEKAEKAWMRITEKELDKKWVRAELMYLLKQYDKAVSEMEESILEKVVELSLHLDLLRDALSLSGNEAMSGEAEDLAAKLRDLFGLWEGFGDMSSVSKSAAASDEDAFLDHLASFVKKSSRDVRISTCPLFSDVKPDGDEKENRSVLDRLDAIFEKIQ